MIVLLTTGVISLISLIGVFVFGKSGRITGTHRFIVPFAIGAFLAVTFFELIPETLEGSELYGSVAIVAGFLFFYFVSNLLIRITIIMMLMVSMITAAKQKSVH